MEPSFEVVFPQKKEKSICGSHKQCMGPTEKRGTQLKKCSVVSKHTQRKKKEKERVFQRSEVRWWGKVRETIIKKGEKIFFQLKMVYYK